MGLLVNKTKKEALQKVASYNKKSVRVIMAISKILFLIGIVVGGGYLVLSFLLPNVSMVSVNGVLQKNTSWIVISSSFILAPCLITSVCMRTLGHNIASSDNAARVDEILSVTDKSLCYSFRIKHQSSASERHVFSVAISDIEFAEIDAKTEAVRLVGKILSEYYEDYKNGRPDASQVVDELIIYDYFTPSLKETLFARDIRFEYVGG